MAHRDRPAVPRPDPARRGPNWVDERASERGDQRVLQAFSSLRAERVYGEAQACPDCTAARDAEGREDALCERHLGEAMGMHADWDPPGAR
jgi:hypothetical protein